MKRFSNPGPFFFLVVLPALMSTIGCGVEAPSPSASAAVAQPIINGKPCDEKTFPSAVAIMLDAKLDVPFMGKLPIRSAICTGTLIAPDVVLAAAHCTDPAAATGGLGMTFTDQKFYITSKADLSGYAASAGNPAVPPPALPKDAVAVKQLIPNAGFSVELLKKLGGGVQSNLFDIAVLLLEKPIPSIEPAVLITKEEAKQLVKGVEVQITGWGQQTPAKASPVNPPPPGTVGKKFCATAHVNDMGPHEMQIGSDTRSARKCHGDSGGPTYLRVKTPHERKVRVVGVTSHAFSAVLDCLSGGVDTRVDVWLDWIDKQLKDACAQNRRVWCEVEGVIPPSYYDPPPVPEAGASGDGGPSSGGESSGCALVAGRGAPSGIGLWLLLWALFARRRRR